MELAQLRPMSSDTSSAPSKAIHHRPGIFRKRISQNTLMSTPVSTGRMPHGKCWPQLWCHVEERRAPPDATHASCHLWLLGGRPLHRHHCAGGTQPSDFDGGDLGPE